MIDQVTSEIVGDVAVVRIDDGKANALSHEIIDAAIAAIDDAESGAKAMVLAGRPGRFSAGFDLAVMTSGPEGARGLLGAGAELFLRLYTARIPVVAACTGHALAAGAITLMSTDVRIGVGGDFKIGLNEVAIGMAVPAFVVELARTRLSKRHLGMAANLATVYDPEGAVDAGFLDRLADDPVEAAIQHAAMLAETLHPAAFQVTRDRLRGESAELIRARIADDLATFTVG